MGSFRKTKQSVLILDIVNNSRDHLNAYEIYEKCQKEINNISLGTVYRNLHNLVDSHQIRQITGLDGTEHYDNIHMIHNHFLCLKCQEISDVFDKLNISINCDLGEVMDYEILYKGICNNCLKKEKN